ncbi:hypothetical protein BD769DRAFT_1388290 [Suillus cothurnatus]|nr:hypothetical protein BD769DRAFT_1388290 [Suillus cothurnatus]
MCLPDGARGKQNKCLRAREPGKAQYPGSQLSVKALFFGANRKDASTSSFTYSIPDSEHTDHSSISLSEFHTLITIDANTYQDHKENVRHIQTSMASLTSNVNDLKGKILVQGANMATLLSNVSTLTAKMLAQGTTLDATYELAQDSMGNSESIRKGMREMNDTMNDIKGEVSAMRKDWLAKPTYCCSSFVY